MTNYEMNVLDAKEFSEALDLLCGCTCCSDWEKLMERFMPEVECTSLGDAYREGVREQLALRIVTAFLNPAWPRG